MASAPDFQRRVEHVDDLGNVRRQLSALIAPFDDEDFVIDAVVAADELLSNCFLHTNDDCTITVWLDRGSAPRIRVEVADGSNEQPVLRTDGRCRGLRIVDGLTSRWGVESQPTGKVVWFEIGQPFNRG